MQMHPTKMFMLRYTEADLDLFSRAFAYVLTAAAAKEVFSELELSVLREYHHELYKTLDTAYDDDWVTDAPDASPAPPEAPKATPVCAVHQKPMVLQQGNRGPFWSCHERNADRRRSAYRPPRA